MVFPEVLDALSLNGPSDSQTSQEWCLMVLLSIQHQHFPEDEWPLQPLNPESQPRVPCTGFHRERRFLPSQAHPPRGDGRSCVLSVVASPTSEGQSLTAHSLMTFILYVQKPHAAQFRRNAVLDYQKKKKKLREQWLTSPSNAGGVGSIPGRGAKIPHASWPNNQNIKQKQ